MKRGFTLIEVFITVIIAAVLSAIAIPVYNKAVQKHQANQAVIYLRDIRNAEKMYFAKHGVYLACTDADAIRSDLGVETTTRSYAFRVQISSNSAYFTAFATRVSDSAAITYNTSGVWTASGGIAVPTE